MNTDTIVASSLELSRASGSRHSFENLYRGLLIGLVLSVITMSVRLVYNIMVEIKGVYSHFEGKLERLTQRLETLENNLEVERNCSRELCEIHERQLNQVVQDVIASFREVEALEERLTTEVARMDNVSSGFYRLIERMDGLENRATNEETFVEVVSMNKKKSKHRYDQKEND